MAGCGERGDGRVVEVRLGCRGERRLGLAIAHSDARRMPPRSSSPASRGDTTRSRCCWNAPSARAGTSSAVYPSSPSVIGAPTSAINSASVSARSSPPSRRAASRWRSNGGRLREPKRGRRRDGDREPVRDERVRRGVARRRPRVLQRRDRVGAGVGDMDARASEPDPGHRRAEHHRASCLEVASVGDSPPQELTARLERLRAPDVGDGIRALVRGRSSGLDRSRDSNGRAV